MPSIFLFLLKIFLPIISLNIFVFIDFGNFLFFSFENFFIKYLSEKKIFFLYS